MLPVVDKFPKVWLIPYNLACYCAQLGQLDECKDWFKKAMAIDEAEKEIRQPLIGHVIVPLWKRLSD